VRSLGNAARYEPDDAGQRDGASKRGTLDATTLRTRARLGVFILAARTALQQLINLGGQVYLARVLGPADFGAFWIVQFVLSFFTHFGDAGLGGALIQQQHEPTKEELASVFWFQNALGVAVVAVVFGTAPHVVQFWPGLPSNGVSMLRALSLGLLLTSARVIPAILLERELLFGRLSFIDLVLAIGFNGAAVLLAHLGYGPFALVGGVLVQGVLGLVAAYALRPWVPSLQFNRALLKPALKFGILFQGKNIIGFANGAVIPLYAGRVLGPYALGIVTFSQNTAFFPVQIILILARVNFPLLSRLRHDPQLFARTLSRTVKLCASVTLLFVGLFLGLGPSLVHVIYGDKWIPALPTLYIFAVAISIGFIVPIMNGSLDALGVPQVMFRLGAAWMLLNWFNVFVAMHIKADALTFTLGYVVHIFVGNLAVIVAVKRLLPDVRMGPLLAPGFVAGTIMGLVARWALLPWSFGPIRFVAAVLAAAALFVGILAIVDRQGLLDLVGVLRKTRRETNEVPPAAS
jgi:PST family polysaccharide transporter